MGVMVVAVAAVVVYGGGGGYGGGDGGGDGGGGSGGVSAFGLRDPRKIDFAIFPVCFRARIQAKKAKEQRLRFRVTCPRKTEHRHLHRSMRTKQTKPYQTVNSVQPNKCIKITCQRDKLLPNLPANESRPPRNSHQLEHLAKLFIHTNQAYAANNLPKK